MSDTLEPRRALRRRHRAAIASALELQRAGLHAEITFVDRPLLVARDHYATKLRGRYMSLLSSFDDAELEAGIAEVLAAHPEPELRVTYRLAFVLGVRAG